MPYTIDQLEFVNEQRNRLIQYFNTNKDKLSGFETRDRFIDWYMNELNISENKCHYCKTSILEIRQLLNDGVIRGRSVGRGGERGSNLEIDRRDPFGEYVENNCVLSCYYCNNDKSNTFDYETYLNIIGPSKRDAWRRLLNN